MRILEHLTLLSPGDLIPYAEALTASMALLLEPAVPRRILQTLNKLWMGLNTVMPRRYVFWAIRCCGQKIENATVTASSENTTECHMGIIHRGNWIIQFVYIVQV